MGCERPGCHCTEAVYEEGGRNHCSEGCAQRPATGEGAPKGCPCGHPDCAAL